MYAYIVIFDNQTSTITQHHATKKQTNPFSGYKDAGQRLAERDLHTQDLEDIANAESKLAPNAHTDHLE